MSGSGGQQTQPQSTQSAHDPPKLEEREGPWTVADGKVSTGGIPQQHFGSDGVEGLTFNNPFSQHVERAWYNGHFVFAVDAGEVEMSNAGNVKVAKEYQPVYAVDLDQQGKRKSEQKIPGQYNIYDSVPGEAKYSAIWQFYYVVVPQDYLVNSLRSEQDCLNSGYPIQKCTMFEN